MSLKTIARECNCSVPAVRRWIRRNEETNNVNDKPRTGRKPALTLEHAEGTLEHLISGQFSGAAHVATHLKQARITCSTLHKSTIIRHAKKAAQGRGDKLKVRRGRPPKRVVYQNHCKEACLCFGSCELPMGPCYVHR